MADTVKMKDKRTAFIHSIKFKIVSIVALSIILTTAFVLGMILPNVQKNIIRINTNYLYDITMNNGTTMERLLTEAKSGAVPANQWNTTFSNVGLQGVKSSYAYVMNADGTFVYHPQSDKIGTKVENKAMNQVISELAAGNRPKTEVKEYEYQGQVKYASYYVSADKSKVLVICADKSEMLSSVNAIIRTGIIVGVISVILFSVIGFFVVKICIKPLEKLSDIIMKMSRLDFTDDAKVNKLLHRKDETGQMSKSVIHMRKELIAMIHTIQKKSEELLNASNGLTLSANETAATIQQVGQAVNDIADGASNQAAETQSATENVIAMGNMIEDTNGHVIELDQNAVTMKQADESSMLILKELVTANQKTKQYMDQVYEQTHRTNESVQKIKAATEIITSIAEETNLLSLNAAIEAARAGEQGRGFAVVATQIQKLAEQSNESAQKIGDITNMLIEDSNTAVKTMQSVKEVIEDQSRKMSETDEMFVVVQDGIKNSADNIHNIGDRIEKMNMSRKSVVDVVSNLSAIAEQNAASTQQTSASVTEVSEIVSRISQNAANLKLIAGHLDDQVKMFQLD